MIIECPECGTKNSADKPPQLGRRYRCGKCGALITFTQTADTQRIFTKVPPEKARPEAKEEIKKEQVPKRRKGGCLGCLGLIAVFIIIVLVVELSPSDDNTQQTPPTQTPTEQTTEATTTYDGVSVYHNRQPQYYGANRFVPVSLSNNVLAKNPTWEELVTFLELDATDEDMYMLRVRVCADFANTLHNNAEKAGIRAAWVALEIEGKPIGHALNAFETTDKGLVFVDSTGSGLILSFSLANNQADMSATKSSVPESNDRIAYVEVGREYGLMSLGIVSSFDYNSYLEYMQRVDDYDTRLEALNYSIAELSKKMDTYNSKVDDYNIFGNEYELKVGGREVIADPREYEELSNMYDELEKRGAELKQEKSQLDREQFALEQESANLAKELNYLGMRRWESPGIVKSVEIYW